MYKATTDSDRNVFSILINLFKQKLMRNFIHYNKERRRRLCKTQTTKSILKSLRNWGTVEIEGEIVSYKNYWIQRSWKDLDQVKWRHRKKPNPLSNKKQFCKVLALWMNHQKVQNLRTFVKTSYRIYVFTGI